MRSPIRGPLKQNKSTTAGVVLLFWLGMKNDYRTLIGLEGVSVVNKSVDGDEVENDE